jgi:hypothetical protein
MSLCEDCGRRPLAAKAGFQASAYGTTEVVPYVGEVIAPRWVVSSESVQLSQNMGSIPEPQKSSVSTIESS